VEPARGLGRILARERDAQRGRRAAGYVRDRARREQAPERGLLAGEGELAGLALGRELRDRRARVARVGLELRERAPGLGDRGLGVAQRFARLAPAGFPFLQLPAQRRELLAQGGEVLLPALPRRRRPRGRRPRQQRGGQGREEKGAPQAFALPWAETAAMRRATSSGSPR
jgi:hypothetical protein